MTDPYTQAMDPDTPVDMLKMLARSPSLDVALAVTRNPSTSPETLDALSEHSHVTVRVGVIKHESTPVETLRRLARAPATRSCDLVPPMRRGIAAAQAHQVSGP